MPNIDTQPSNPRYFFRTQMGSREPTGILPCQPRDFTVPRPISQPAVLQPEQLDTLTKRQLVNWAQKRRLHGVGGSKASLQRICQHRAQVEAHSPHVRHFMVMDVSVTTQLASLPSTADASVFNLDLSLSCPFDGDQWKTLFEVTTLDLLPVCSEAVMLAHIEQYDALDFRLSAAKQLRDLSKHRIIMDTLAVCEMQDASKDIPVVFLRASVTASMASIAHKAAVILDLQPGTRNATRVRMALCSCKAGLSGMCGHVFALALLQDRPQAPLEAESVTSRACVWARPTKGPRISNLTPIQKVALSPRGTSTAAASVGSAVRHNHSLAMMPVESAQLTQLDMRLWWVATKSCARKRGATTAEMTRVADAHAIGTFTKKRALLGAMGPGEVGEREGIADPEEDDDIMQE
jgi:hypothetical protein